MTGALEVPAFVLEGAAKEPAKPADDARLLSITGQRSAAAFCISPAGQSERASLMVTMADFSSHRVVTRKPSKPRGSRTV